MKLNKNFKTYFLSYAASFLVLYFLICMITNPSLYISKSLDGLSAWAFNVLPSGAKMVADLYLQGKITKNDAFKMTSFCSTSGPMFIVGAVGAGMFKSAKIGYILFLSHAIGAILNGLIYRNLKIKEQTPPCQFCALAV